MADERTARLLDRFVTDIRSIVPVVAVWAHGSLAGGDYQEGRSDLDLVAVLERPCRPGEERRLVETHENLTGAEPLASHLHCGYLAAGELADPARDHLVWAHEELFRRPVTPISRRELHEFGLVLHGEAPAALLPPVPAEQLAAFVVEDLTTFWRPALDHPERWLEDIWVDLGLLTLARASVTLRDGTLITKGQALGVLRELGAPAEVVDDIRRRRYDDPGPASPEWLGRRARLSRGFLGPAIDRVAAEVSTRTASPPSPSRAG
ncbi:nucleotidyltransferase domain-containing protein [Sphaerisporangium sp. TRM90804]|uniref:nucleotidyltransferase domain-containing protein n=1 Tax=Sphaerisporangium sp. TRM90804 TaxID=3031113 RepID=UPI00244B8921|nr:nucleotidyltransferase domain-containing protein [Sphaerisporangium sp. TRM90804]MDH2426632.1 nucleotidyltransferase domain-containing protein [Sphaerisporangium sp. TRM90804]